MITGMETEGRTRAEVVEGRTVGVSAGGLEEAGGALVDGGGAAALDGGGGAAAAEVDEKLAGTTTPYSAAHCSTLLVCWRAGHISLILLRRWG